MTGEKIPNQRLENLYSSIGKLIGEGLLDDAISELLNLSKFGPQELNDEAIVLQGRLSSLERDYVQGRITDQRSEKVLIRQAALELRNRLLDRLNQSIPDPPTPEPELAVTSVRRSHIPIPSLPTPYVAHEYKLMKGRPFIGREHDKERLLRWLEFGEESVCCVVGVGGQGKSALTWNCFQHLVDNPSPKLVGAMWWSFYATDGIGRNFVLDALSYVTQTKREELSNLSYKEQTKRLKAELSANRYIIVLDGFERELYKYSDPDRNALEDDDFADDTYDVGLSAMTTEHIRKRFLRKIVDDVLAYLLWDLCDEGTKSRVLISTRLLPVNLEEPSGKTCSYCYRHDLHGLEPVDSLDLWNKTVGVDLTTPSESLAKVFENTGHHPLAIRVLASRVRGHRGSRKDFERWRELNPGYDLDGDLEQVKTNILKIALEGLNSQEADVLGVLLSFPSAPPYDYLIGSLVGDNRPIESEKRLHDILDKLEDRGLIGWDYSNSVPEMHQLVRFVVRTRMAPALPNYETLISSFLDKSDRLKAAEIQSLEDMKPFVDRFHLYCDKAERSHDPSEEFDAACALFLDRLDLPTRYKLGACRKRFQMLQRLLEREHPLAQRILDSEF